jgi:hypothetical protein
MKFNATERRASAALVTDRHQVPKQGKDARRAEANYMLDDWRLFSPKLDDDGSGYALLAGAIVADPNQTAQALQQIAQRSNIENIKALRTRASALLLRDLVSMGWELKNDANSIYIRPASSTSGPSKAAIRKQLEFGRNDQLSEPATRRFILNLERPGRFSSCRSITDLIADGRRLAGRVHGKLTRVCI